MTSKQSHNVTLTIAGIQFDINIESLTSELIPHGKHTVTLTTTCETSTINVYTKTVDKTDFDLLKSNAQS